MSFPLSPTNGQQASINGVTYVYSSALTAWTVSTGFGGTFLNISVTDTVNSGNLAVTGLASVTGNITGGNFIGNGSQLTSIPISTGVSGLGTGIATFLGTPSSTNLAAAVTDETGSGSLVFATAPSLSGVVINDGYTEEVYAVVDAAGVAISPTNGSIQTWTLGASRTPTAGTWAAGQSLTLMINDGTAFTVTWTSLGVVWVGGSAPTLATTGFTVIQLWKVSTTIYGALTGSVA